MRRTDVQLSEPPADLAGFPRALMPAGSVLYRSHGAANPDGSPRSPWWFSSSSTDPRDDGRFDLESPRGTCYLAANPVAALRERFGQQLAHHEALDIADVAKTAVSRVALQEDAEAADTCHEDAANWVTREIATVGHYALTQRWARAFDGAGCDGVLYQARFSTEPVANALALFGDAGGRAWPVEGTEDAVRVLRDAGVVVKGAAKLAALTKATPPA